MLSYKRNRRDTNENDIIIALKNNGFSVVRLNASGESGLPDLLCGKNGVNYLVEIKSLKGKLSEAQEKFAIDWLGLKPVVVRTKDDISSVEIIS